MKTDEKKQNQELDGRIEETAKKRVRHFRDLDVYQNALESGLRVYELSKKFPKHVNAEDSPIHRFTDSPIR